MIIGVTQRISYLKQINEYRFSIDINMFKFVIASGHIPVSIPSLNSLLPAENSGNMSLSRWINEVGIEGIILSGGEDINSNIDRDKFEINLITYAKRLKLPLLGICRGMQIMSKASNVKLKKNSNHVKTRHKIFGIINREVNSFHNYSIEKCPQDFKITSRSDDLEIESICHIFLPWEGWMWHPEREKIFDRNDISRFKKIFKKNI